jgi:hypothetical protein
MWISFAIQTVYRLISTQRARLEIVVYIWLVNIDDVNKGLDLMMTEYVNSLFIPNILRLLFLALYKIPNRLF